MAVSPDSVTFDVADSSSPHQSDQAVLDLTIQPQQLNPTTVYTYAATYDGDGNVQQYQDTVMGNWIFTYDAFNRIESATASSSGTGSNDFTGQSLCWAYDSYGNRTAQEMQSSACPSQESGVTATQAYNGNNQLSSGLYGYDASGNVTTDATTGNTYLYDAEGRVCAVKREPVQGNWTMTGYLYDANGARIAKGTITTMSCDPTANGFQISENYVLGPSGEELSMLDGNNNWQRTNVYAGGKLIGTYDTSGLHFQIEDPLGTRRMQVSGNPNYVGQPETDIQSFAYGDELFSFPDANAPPTADDATPLYFTGKERDAESGNDYFGARYYASTMGRFLSPDWSAKVMPVPYAKLDNPQSLNLYSYVRNNPLSRVDKDGHCSAPSVGKGQVGVCIDLYIQAKTINLVGQGDNRGPAANDPKATHREEIQLVMDPRTGSVTIAKSDPGVSKALGGLGGFLAQKGSDETSLSTPVTDDKGTTHFTVSNEALNGLHDLPGAPKDSIKTTINMDVTADGKVGIEGGVRTAYPSMEVYSYDSAGQSKTLLQVTEHNPSDLANQNQPIPQVAPQ